MEPTSDLAPTAGPVDDAVEWYRRGIDTQRRHDDEQRAQRDAEARRGFREYIEFTEQHCRAATPAEYAEWLTGFLHAGGYASHPYDYPMPKWWLLKSPPEQPLPTLYGAQSFRLLVPAEVEFTPADVPATFHGQCGHSNVFFMDGFRAVPPDWVPLYSDVVEILEEG